MYFKRVNKKIEDNLKGFDISFNKLESLKIQLQELMSIQNQINLNLQISIESQKEELSYLKNINNSIKIEKFKLQFFKIKNASNIVKNSVKSEKSILTKRLKNKEKKTHINKNYIMLYMMMICKVNIVKELNNEEGIVNNSPYLRNLKETKVVKTLFSKFDKK